MTFAAQIRKHVDRLGTNQAARICDVTTRTLQLWMQGAEPNASTRAGAILLLKKNPKRKPASR